MSDSPGLLDFAIGPVNSVINLPDGQVKLFEEFKLQKNCEINLLLKTFLGLVKMMLGLVNVSFSLPERQAVKMTFSAPWLRLTLARNLDNIGIDNQGYEFTSKKSHLLIDHHQLFMVSPINHALPCYVVWMPQNLKPERINKEKATTVIIP